MEFTFKASDTTKHSAAHVMAAAVKRIFPNVKVGVGPVTKQGYYYDFEIGKELSADDLILIEKNCQQIIQEDIPFKRVLLNRVEAQNMLLQMGQIYKSELVQTIPDEEVSFYKLGEEFVDLCRGPHVKSTGELGIIKLTNIESTFWNNDTSRPQMYRIAGVVFQNIIEYNEYMEAVKSQSSRDFVKASIKHQLIFKKDKELYLTAKGSSLLEALQNNISESFRDFNVQKLTIPLQLEKAEATSILDKEYSRNNRSYKELPLFLRANYIVKSTSIKEKILMPHSLWKVYLNKTNAIMTTGSIVERILDLTNFWSKDEINVELRCSNLDDPLVSAISSLLERKIISHNKILTKTNNESTNLEFRTTDSVGKPWVLCSMSVSQSDELKYYSDLNIKEKSRNISYEFDFQTIFGYLIEEYGLKLPFEVSPYQVILIPKSKKQFQFVEAVSKALSKNRIRHKVDLRSKSLNYKIFDAERNNANFIFVVGNKEEINNAVSVRHNNLEVGLVGIGDIYKFMLEHKDKE